MQRDEQRDPNRPCRTEERERYARRESPGQCRLEELLSRITEDNVHDVIPTGKPVGKEAW